jgi:hypothetical protein
MTSSAVTTFRQRSRTTKNQSLHGFSVDGTEADTLHPRHMDSKALTAPMAGKSIAQDPGEGRCPPAHQG